MFYISVQTL